MTDAPETLPAVPLDSNAEGALAPTIDGAATSQAVASPVLPQLGHFMLMKKLGSGGMGTVYAAYDDRLDRRVAIKLLHRAEKDQQHWQRTLREAKALARVSHPNVVGIYEAGETAGQAYLAMEFVDGVTLRAWQKQSPRSWKDVLSIYLAAGQGLLAAHKVDIIHRDFKPANVLVGSDGRPRVVDFGLARLGFREDVVTTPEPSTASHQPLDSFMTAAGNISGTPGYMSPEQYMGIDVDSRSDQWSFCAALHEALYGRLPFEGTSVEELAVNVSGKMRPLPATTLVPIELHQILSRGLAVEPEQRYPSMAELLDALEDELGDSPTGAAEARQRWLVPLVITGAFLSLLAQLRVAGGGISVNQAIISSLVLIGIALVFSVASRQTLLRNAFHRRMVTIIVMTLFENLGQRLVAHRLGISMHSLYPLEMISWAGSTTLIALWFLPSIRWLPAVLLVASAAGAVLSQRWAPVLASAYPLTMLTLAVAWSRATTAAPGSRDGAAGRGSRDRWSGSGGSSSRHSSVPQSD